MVRKGGLEPRLGTGRITKIYQYLPSQPETKRKHCFGSVGNTVPGLGYTIDPERRRELDEWWEEREERKKFKKMSKKEKKEYLKAKAKRSINA